MAEDFDECALEYHRSQPPGKIAVVPTKPLENQRDLALAYSPGVRTSIHTASAGTSAQLERPPHRKTNASHCPADFLVIGNLAVIAPTWRHQGASLCACGHARGGCMVRHGETRGDSVRIDCPGGMPHHSQAV